MVKTDKPPHIRRGCAFEQKRPTNHSAEQERITYLQNKIQKVLAELMAEHVALKKRLGTLTGVWVPHDTRDQIYDEPTFVKWADAGKRYAVRGDLSKVPVRSGGSRPLAEINDDLHMVVPAR